MDNTSLDYTDTWVIIPCFNEGAVIGDVIRNVRHVFPNVVAVNDGSTDDSAAQIKAAGAHQVKDVVEMLDRLRTGDLDIVVGTRFGRPRPTDDQVPLLKRIVLKTVVFLSPKTRRLGLTDAHNGLRTFNRKVADELNIRMNGMSHASEFVTQMDERGWRVAEQSVDILYTEYSMSKGQSLINGVNILADGLLARKLP